MSKYLEIVSQIDMLTKEAKKVKKSELASTIKTIRKQISAYGLTAADLGLSTKAGVQNGSKRAESNAVKPGKRSKSKITVPVKYKDTLGNTWTGRGKQPTWIAKSLAEGRVLEDFLIRKP